MDTGLGQSVFALMIVAASVLLVAGFLVSKLVFKRGYVASCLIALLLAGVGFFITPYAFLEILHLRGIWIL